MDCKQCEKELISDYASLSIKYDRAMGYNKLLLEALDIKEELNKMLRVEIEELQTKLKTYEGR